jgi:hypothetical protein
VNDARIAIPGSSVDDWMARICAWPQRIGTGSRHGEELAEGVRAM